MVQFRAIREDSKRKGISQQYAIVFDHNRKYTLARVRYETYGPRGAGWNVRCSECDEDLQRLTLAKFHTENRQFPLSRALELFRMAYEELEAENNKETQC